MNSPDIKAVSEYILDEYGIYGDHPWQKDPDSCVFRHPENSKWFALTMNVSYSVLGIDKDGTADILNVKCDPLLIGSLTENSGYLPAYHMNKNHWITILLDGSLPKEQIYPLIDMSYNLTL